MSSFRTKPASISSRIRPNHPIFTCSPPPCGPELNPAERVGTLIRPSIANRIFADGLAMEAVITAAQRSLGTEPARVTPLGDDGWLVFTGENLSADDFDALVDFVQFSKCQFERAAKKKSYASFYAILKGSVERVLIVDAKKINGVPYYIDAGGEKFVAVTPNTTIRTIAQIVMPPSLPHREPNGGGLTAYRG